MKKIFKLLLIALYLSVSILSAAVSFSFKTVEAENYDMDENWDNKIKTYTYEDIHKTYEMVSVSESKGHKYPKVDELDDGKTNIHPINVKNSTEYIVGFTDYFTMGQASILIVDDKGEKLFEKKVDLVLEGWKEKIFLPKGKYYIQILAQDEEDQLGFEYELYVKPAIVVKKETKSLKMNSCYTKKLNPNLGKGSWKTSNKNIVSLISSNTEYISSCKVRAKKVGTATITFKNDSGSVIKYKIKVRKKCTYPLEAADFSMDSVGGVKPVIYIANNSDKKIKYIYLTVSFYNAVGDKLRNEIGGYTSANLQITGPISPWDNEWYEWNPVFYNSTARKMKVETMTIVYFGGSKKTVKINRKY